MAKPVSSLPAPLARAARRFREWRSSRTTHRIPPELWSLATDLGARHGVSRSARALRIDYCALRKRVEAAQTVNAAPADGAPAFVEILTAPSAETSDCLVEFESSVGAKMRILMKGASTSDLAELARLFLEERA